MGYSNETPNYHLPQYVADDRPSYLGDWNEAMGKIDAGMEENKENTAANGVAITNMREYVDNKITGMNDTLNEKMTEVDTSITAVDASLAAMGIRVDSVEDKISIYGNKKVLLIGDSYCTNDPGRSGIGDQLNGYATNWDISNYADAGSCFSFGGVNGRTFQAQLIYAATQLNPSDIDILLIVGGRNEVGAQDSGSAPSSSLYGLVQNCLLYAHSTFPNAKIIFFPMVYDWKAPNGNVLDGYNIMLDAANSCVCNVVEGCYTWGCGDESTLYMGGTDIHPNTPGALYMSKIIYNKVVNNDINAWRNRSFSSGSLTMKLINGYVTIIGAATQQTEVAPSSLPSWFYNALPIDSSLTEGRKHIIGIQNSDNSMKVVSISRQYGVFVEGYDSGSVIFDSSTHLYIMGS